MNVQAAMQQIGELNGQPLFWAEPGRFTSPGFYVWDGKRNVRIVDRLRPLPWDDSDDESTSDKGFHIENAPEDCDDPDAPWRLVWGEGEPEYFRTREDAKVDAERQWAEFVADQLDPLGFDFVAHLRRQRDWSERTFGPGERAAACVDHIRKELLEIEAAPRDLREWLDVVALALDGAWRAGHSSEAIVEGIVAMQTRNEGRRWPDWRTAEPGKAIEHDRGHDAEQDAWKRAGGTGLGYSAHKMEDPDRA